MLVPSKKYKVEEVKLNPYKYESILRMSSLEAGDFDEYRCVSENTIGKSEAVINVYSKYLTWSLSSVFAKFYQYIEYPNINQSLFFVEIEPELEIKSTESNHIQNIYVKNIGHNSDSDSVNNFDGKLFDDSLERGRNDKNNDPFRKNKSTPYGTTNNQRRNTKGRFQFHCSQTYLILHSQLHMLLYVNVYSELYLLDNKNSGYMKQNEKIRNKEERNGFAGSNGSRHMAKHIVASIFPVLIHFVTGYATTSSYYFVPLPSSFRSFRNQIIDLSK